MRTTLQACDVIMIGGARYRVEYVTFTRAHCVALDGREVGIGDRSFRAPGRACDISPAADVEIVTRDKRMKATGPGRR